jgi:DNA (cytosine-5)-methyltransferase 1
MPRDPYSCPPIPSVGKARPAFVDLFAGSGGLSLGLEIAGFKPVYVNELDPSAMATYIGNRLRDYPNLVRDRTFDIHDLSGHEERRRRDSQVESWAKEMRGRHGEIALVAGGPPCQGYSSIGHRRTFDVERYNVPSNHLYRDMAHVIEGLRPRMFLFENVANLLHARWTRDGDAGEIWDDVLGTFQQLDDYEVHWDKLYAREFGVPQNRPRLFIVGIRRDLGFVASDVKRAKGLLPEPEGTAPNPEDFLGDLVDPEFASKAATVRYPSAPKTLSQRWFRHDPVTCAPSRRGDPLTDHAYSRHALRIVEKFEYMIETDGLIRESDRTAKFAQRLLPKRWGSTGPNITATSLPDDYVHFSQPRTLTVREWARLQTFPDWYQFYGNRTTGGRRRAGDPDAGNWTREVPKYTQIGNAVPVLIAIALGRHFRKLAG